MADLDSLSGRVLGEFVLRERIDEGGFGAVYRCEQPLLGRAAVVKVPHQRLRRRDVTLQRFMREAQLASRLDHPYAAHVYAFGIEHDDGLLWIAMELVQGITLTRWLRERGPMPLEQLVPFFERVAEVVQVAHDTGIVHRDLKPANVMVVERAGQLLPKLLDFGVAKILDEAGLPDLLPSDAFPDESWSADPDRTPPMRAGTLQPANRPAGDRERLTRASAAIGSPPYMAPEQWETPLSVGPASDIYALGIIAYEALTGRRPFTAETAERYGHLHRKAPIPPLGAGFAPALDRLFARALAKLPSRRWGRAIDFAAALRSEHELRRRGRLVAAARRWRRAVVAVAAAAALAGIQYRSYVRAQMAEERVVTAEVEQGRQALLHGESAEALPHLAAAYRRGERGPGVEFMLARAMQPRLAELARLPATNGRMWSAAWSRDGARIVTSDDRSAAIWDASGRRLFTLGHGATVYAAAFVSDGARLFTASADGTVRSWDARTGAQLRAFSTQPSRPYYAIAAAGRLVAAIDTNGAMVHAWDTETGALLAELAIDGDGYPVIALSPDGRWLAAGGGNAALIFDTATWRLVATLPGRVRALAFDPTGPRIATGTADGDASIWDIPGGTRAHHLREIGEPIDVVAFDRAGALLVTAARDGAEQIWRTSSGKLVGQVNAHHGRITAAEFDTTGARLLAAGATGAIAVTDVAQGTVIAMLEGPSNLIRAAHWAPGGARIVAASWEGAARIWDTTPPYERFRSAPIAEDCGVAASLEPDRRFVAIGCYDAPTRVWDTARDTLIAELPGVVTPLGFELPLPAVSVDGRLAAIARGAAAELYALPGGARTRVVTAGAAVSAIAFAASGEDLVTGDVAGGVVLARGGLEPVALPPLGAGVDAVAIAADGRVIAAGGTYLRIYSGVDLELGARTRVLRLNGERLLMIPNKAAAAAPVLVDLARGVIVARLDGHVGAVYGARFVEGGRILTAGTDGTARLWDGATGLPLQIYRGSPRFLVDAALVSPAIVVAGGSDGLLRFWELDSGRPLWTLAAHRSYVVGIRIDGDDIVTRAADGSVARWSVQNLQRMVDAKCVGDVPPATREACSMLRR